MKNKIGLNNIRFGWSWLFVGILMAMWIGLFAFKSEWLGGYAGLTRRFLRLAHLSFMALSLTNILYGLCIDAAELSLKYKRIGSYTMINAAVFMPTICLLTIWNRFFENLFFIPAGSFACAVFIMAFGYIKKEI
ncbi:MAG: hypothetical protein KJ915_02105 [Candidatus Omnitrophica bacterium]|nr:hypothetical protein [Candidatus Omnitrophota bacterium]